MPDRRFEVLHPVAGLAPGSEVGEADLAGCNVDALVEGGLLRDMAAAAAPTAIETPPPPAETGG